MSGFSDDALARIDAVVRREPRLTRRQLDCLRCASVGMTTRETAQFLGISVWTVKDHLMRARWKLNARRTVDAVAIALDKELW